MPAALSSSLWQRIAREPLAHFVAIGAVLYAIHAWRSPAPAPPVADTTARQPIAVDRETLAEVGAQTRARLGREPTGDELEGAVEQWIDREILYREGLERGLDRNDPMIRDRVATRMGFVLAQAAHVPEPTEAELRAWFADNRERWNVPERVDFTHVYVAGHDDDARARAAKLAAALEAGAGPERLGDRFSGGHRYRGRRLDDLATAFGADFAAGLTAQEPGAWVERPSRFGIHLVRVDRAEPGRAADFASARLDVLEAWRAARRDTARQDAVARVRAGWEITRP